MEILFVINPGSGTQTIDWEAEIHNFFEPLDHTTDFFKLSGKNDAVSLSRKIKERNWQLVVAVGGDGTVTLVAKHVLGTPITMGILPAGSANGMAKELNIPEDAGAALKILTEGKALATDVIRINDEDICVHLSDIGMNAQLIKYFDEGKLRGKWGYARVILKTLWHRRKVEVVIESKGFEVRRKAFMVVLANASKYGTGAVINPEGNLHDGLFEVVIVRRLALSELIKMLFIQRPFNPKKIEVVSATSVAISTKGKVHFQVDGEYKGKISHLTAKIIHAKLNLMMPNQG